ncbi:MAG TPA: peptidase C39, partial [Acinetobacter junii]|nr:peptidase C39 [Acinetobacter junii]
MSLDIPDPLLQLEANCGVFAVWLILKQYQSNIDIAELIQLCRHDYNEGTF